MLGGIGLIRTPIVGFIPAPYSHPVLHGWQRIDTQKRAVFLGVGSGAANDIIRARFLTALLDPKVTVPSVSDELR
jgi:hypothetical protein